VGTGEGHKFRTIRPGNLHLPAPKRPRVAEVRSKAGMSFILCGLRRADLPYSQFKHVRAAERVLAGKVRTARTSDLGPTRICTK